MPNDLDDASNDFLAGGTDTQALLERRPEPESVPGPTPVAPAAPSENGPTPAPATPTSQEPGETPPAGPGASGGGLPFDLTPTTVAATPPTAEEGGTSEVSPQADEFPYDFGASRYTDFDSLKRGVMQKDETIRQRQVELESAGTTIQGLKEELLGKDAEIAVISNLYREQMPEEDSLVDLFARALLPEQYREKTDADFTLDPEAYMVDESKYAVNQDEYDDNEDYREALKVSRKKLNEAQKRLDTKMRADHLASQEQYREFTQLRTDARQQVMASMDEQKRLAVDAESSRADRIKSASTELHNELNGESLGIVLPEHTAIAENLLKESIQIVIGSEVKSKTLSEALPLVRANFGKRVTDLIIKGMRHEIRGDARPSSNPPAPPRPTTVPRTRGVTPPLPNAQSNTREESKSMFEEAGWAN